MKKPAPKALKKPTYVLIGFCIITIQLSIAQLFATLTGSYDNVDWDSVGNLAPLDLIAHYWWIANRIVYLFWLYRLSYNLKLLSGRWVRFTPGWTVAWYLIPIANFYKPFQAMKEMWGLVHQMATSRSTLLGRRWTSPHISFIA